MAEGEWNGEAASAPEERRAGQQSYLQLLKLLHLELAPQFYLEVGVRHGASLMLASCRAVGVDPEPELHHALGSNASVSKLTSDEFFLVPPSQSIDLGFIDGLHLFEQALRDFINIELHSRSGAVVIVDDILPNHPTQALRSRRSRVWTGDVWKLRDVLSRYRPDLFTISVDTAPTGSLLVAGLDPNNTTLRDRYAEIVAQWTTESPPPPRVLNRGGALAPDCAQFRCLLNSLKESRQASLDGKQTVARLRQAGRPAVSVIIIGYNMSRELPRTIRSFSPGMQRDVFAEDYELILIDNGSTRPFDKQQLLDLAPNLAIHEMTNATVSPVRAINHGLTIARGDLVGVCIDGARMGSPGLLAAAIQAAKLHPRPVIGTFSFHLGAETQMKSVLKGYNQDAEDKLLEEIRWIENGYRLFEVSVFAGSAAAGWFKTPAETNALFMRAEHWRALGGFDERFVSPGGGLANLDMWKRACEDLTGELIMLLGEGTFHQVHGGVATNATLSPKAQFREEYERIRGESHRWPEREACYLGAFPPEARATFFKAASVTRD